MSGLDLRRAFISVGQIGDPSPLLAPPSDSRFQALADVLLFMIESWWKEKEAVGSKDAPSQRFWATIAQMEASFLRPSVSIDMGRIL